MADLAQLGFAVDSTPLARAKAEMHGMVPAARGAQEAVAELSSASGGLAAAAARTGQALGAQSASVQRLAADYNRLSDMQRRINAATGVTGMDIGRDRGADIAAYGQALDALRAKYNPLFAAQRQYRQELIDIRSALRQGAINEREYADAITNTKVAFTAQVNSLRGVTDRDNFFDKTAEGVGRAGKAFQGLSFDARNLSFQLVDVGQGLLMGQSPFMIFAQQAGQIGQIIGTSPQGLTGLMRELGSAIARVVTPMRLVGLGVAATGAAALSAAASWKTYALAIDDVRRLSGMSSTMTAGLTSSAGFKGIGSDDFLSGFRAFSSEVAQARNGVGDLAVQFRAMNQPIGTAQETFERLADAVKNARDDHQRMQILTAAGLPASRQWVDYMSQGADGIREAVRQANLFGGAANDSMVRRAKDFDDAWNRAITNLRNGWNKLFLDVFGWFDDLSSKGTAALIRIASYLPQSLRPDVARNILRTSIEDNAGSRMTQNGANDFYRSVSTLFRGEREDTTPDPTKIIALNNRYIQLIGTLGDFASIEQQVSARGKELENQFLQNGIGVGKYKDAILNAVRAQVEMSRVREQASIGVFDFGAANQAAQHQMQVWITKGLLDPTNVDQMTAAWTAQEKKLRDLSDAAKVAASDMPQLTQAMLDAANLNRQFDQFATGAFNNITTGLTDIFDGTKSAGQGFADLGKTVVRALEEMLIKMYVVLPLFNALRGAMGGGFGGLFGGGGSSVLPFGNFGFTANALGGVYPGNDNGISRYSNQIVSTPTLFAFARGAGLMGEAGPEAIMPLKRGPDGRLGVEGGSGGSPQFNIIVNGAERSPNVSQRQNVSGGRDIMIDFRDAVRGVIAEDAANNGPMSQSISGRIRGFGGR